MTYDKDYSSLEGNEKRSKAIQDVIEYLGIERFVQLTEGVRNMSMTPDEFIQGISLSGVQGYPVRAWYEHIFGWESWTKED